MMIEQVRTIIREHGRLTSSFDALSDESDLYRAGMTSQASVNVMLALESEFDIEFPDSMLKRSVYPEDIAEAIRFARQHRLTVAARGTAHSAGGQTLAPGGLVVAMRSLARIGPINLADRWIEVEAGALWSEVLAETLVHGLRPPVIPDWLEMTVGGTLSFGGIGAESFRAGTQTDHVLELEVVTGTGETLCCSAARNSALFNAVRAGLGQFGIITRARLALAFAVLCVSTGAIFARSADAAPLAIAAWRMTFASSSR